MNSKTDTSYFHPNYFAAIKISNPNIHKAIIDVQKSLLDANLDTMPCLTDVASLHITLLVVRIQNDNELFAAHSALDRCGAILSKKIANSPIHLSFRGLSNFSQKVIFTKLVEDNHYLKLLDIGRIVKEEFSRMNVTITNQRELNPHLTIARLSEMPNTKEKTLLNKIDHQFHNCNFGTQILSGIQLLSRIDPKDHNGYYFVQRQVSFDVSKDESSDHTYCCLLHLSSIKKM